MRIAYVIARYPAVSHTFIQREIHGLRELGVNVMTLAIKRTEPDELLSEADRDADGTTWTIQPPDWGVLAWAHLRALARAPLRYMSTLALALRLNPGGFKRLLWQFFYFVEAIALWDHLDHTEIRHIHSHFANVACAVTMLASTYGGRGWSWSMTMHGSLEFYDVEQHWLPEKFRRAGFVVCISDFCRSQVSRNLDAEQWHKLETVHCGVDTTLYTPEDRVAGREGQLRILTIGRLAAEKGQEHLLSASARLIAQGRDVELTIIGDGPREAALRELANSLGIADRVTMPGAVGQDEIRDYYARADVFCLPSFAEGVPVVLMEAMAMEIPVVATRLMGIPELVDDEQSGLLVAPASEDALVTALERLDDDAALRDRLGRAGRAKVIAEFEISDLVVQLRDIFAARVGNAGAPSSAPRAAELVQ
jgi:glycosyltransferase involved in cell wall biosynthesis